MFNWIWCNYGGGQRLQLTLQLGASRIQVSLLYLGQAELHVFSSKWHLRQKLWQTTRFYHSLSTRDESWISTQLWFFFRTNPKGINGGKEDGNHFHVTAMLETVVMWVMRLKYHRRKKNLFALLTPLWIHEPLQVNKLFIVTPLWLMHEATSRLDWIEIGRKNQQTVSVTFHSP